MQQIFGALAECRDRILDYGATLFLLLHGGALLLGLPPLGDVLVRVDPAAALHRMILDQQETLTRGLDLVLNGAPLPNRGYKILPVLMVVAIERALRDPSRQHLRQRGSRFCVGRRQIIHFIILRVADDQPLRRIEHAQPLRHAVDGGVHLLVFPAQMLGEQGVGQAHRKLGDERSEDHCEYRFGNGGDDCGDPAGGEDNQHAETRRKSGEPSEHDQPPARLGRAGAIGPEHDCLIRIGRYGIPRLVFLVNCREANR